MNKINDKPVQIGEKKTRYTFKLYDEPSQDPRMRLVAFFQALVDQPALLHCGPLVAQKMAFYHNGNAWVLAAEAEGDSL